jgi:hypothetical protein
MATTASGREIYSIGREKQGNREVIVQEDGTIHDLPAGAEVTYASELSRFPYEL